MKRKYDFSGWATRNDLACGDGRTIRRDAFKDCDGKTVPLVWNHQHNDPSNILGHALLENRQDGVYAYCTFNETESGKAAKLLVQHGDIEALSICANQLKQHRGDVLHGNIREVSMTVAGQNPGAFIDFVEMAHGDDFEEEMVIGTGEPISLYHADPDDDEGKENGEGAKPPAKDKPKEEPKPDDQDGETVEDVLNSMTDKQKKVVYALVGAAISKGADKDEDTPGKKKPDDSEGGDKTMKHNVFDKEEDKTVLSHSDQASIIALAKQTSVGSLRAAMEIYCEENKDTLTHGIDDIEALFPDYKDVRPGAPELIERDQSWVAAVMKKARKSPISRVRTRQADARANELKAKGYDDRTKAKALSGNLKLIMRTTDPQTVYVRDELHRDDVIDITDFDVVAYQKMLMRRNLEEEIALATLVGDGREDVDPDKIHEDHIRSIWHDADLYTIHADVDIAAAKAELQGTNTGANFGENYIYAEAIVTASLYAREKYKGKGELDFYCTPHVLNVMLLARDLNGRRIYDSKSDLAKALNAGEIHTVEQFEGLTRTTDSGDTKKLLGIFVNMGNYQLGSTKGGEITNFDDFDIDFNKYKYLLETRLSGALTEIYSAIALEEPVSVIPAG